jgi:two-component system sensor histidine kinase ChiS
VNIANDLPEVHADKLRLNQILLNLVSNAIKFTKKGEIVIEAEVFEDNPHQMFICVIDEGIGIPKDKFGTIFNRFSQADSSTTREYGGTGLGLPICKQLAEMHGGTIGVESEVGVGSKFFFTIPLADFVVSEESSQ